MKKILGIFAASAAALGSAMIAAPAHAQSAILPVEVEVTPAIFLRTYSDLKFIVSQQDLQGGTSVDQTTGTYDEKAGITPLSTETPTGSENLTVTKTVPVYTKFGGVQLTRMLKLLQVKILSKLPLEVELGEPLLR
ncbi:MAG: hypothetical protein HC917_11865 [Richelia sp. SM2_1_7]|nr:hypothetical protein [Richelia sp. SM2_1_7]